MVREGRHAEFRAAVERLNRETSQSPSVCYGMAMKEFGYKGLIEEQKLHRVWLAEQERQIREVHKSTLQASIDKVQAELREEQKIIKFEEALRRLPKTASVAEELDWIRSHPAMSRKARQVKKTMVVITVDDVLTSNGPAPSQSAVHALQNWANRPDEFFKQLLQEHKKKSEEGGTPEVCQDDLIEAKRLLMEVTSSKD